MMLLSKMTMTRRSSSIHRLLKYLSRVLIIQVIRRSPRKVNWMTLRIHSLKTKAPQRLIDQIDIQPPVICSQKIIHHSSQRRMMTRMKIIFKIVVEAVRLLTQVINRIQEATTAHLIIQVHLIQKTTILSKNSAPTKQNLTKTMMITKLKTRVRHKWCRSLQIKAIFSNRAGSKANSQFLAKRQVIQRQPRNPIELCFQLICTA